MKTNSILTLAAGLVLSAASAGAATLSHRYSFNGDTTDSVGGNTGVLTNGAGVTPTHLTLSGGPGAGASVQNMRFSSAVGIGANYGATGVTVETWYTDNGSGNWAKLFTFGRAQEGFEFAYTNARADFGNAAPDRNGAHTFGMRPSLFDEHHLVISLAPNGNMNAWVDGTQLLTNRATNPISNVGTEVESIGATAWGDPGHNGTVNEFRIWSGELTNAEVQANLVLGPNSLVPEPTGLALLGLGSVALLRRRRRA